MELHSITAVVYDALRDLSDVAKPIGYPDKGKWEVAGITYDDESDIEGLEVSFVWHIEANQFFYLGFSVAVREIVREGQVMCDRVLQAFTDYAEGWNKALVNKEPNRDCLFEAAGWKQAQHHIALGEAFTFNGK